MTTTERASWLDVAETAALLSVSAATVRAHALELGGVRIGRVWRFPPDFAAPAPRNGGRRPTPDKERLR
jgi:hypothetical protein